MKIVSAEVKKEEFKDLMKNDLSNFRQHVQRKEAQYSELLNLKGSSPASHALIQMDFNENNLSQTVEEVQSAYWN